MTPKNEKIQKSNLIFCEGADEKWFLIRFLNSTELEEKPFFSKDIQVMDFGGNEELPQELEVLKLSPGFASLTSLLIIRDAEKDGKKAVSQIQSSLEKVDLPVPAGPGEWKAGKLKVGFLLFPTCDKTVQNGTLEDLCLSILKQPDHPAMLNEIQTFLELLKQEHQQSFPHEHKTKLHTYFSITDKFVGMKIGEAADAKAFDWNSDKLDFLKSFLLEAET